MNDKNNKLDNSFISDNRTISDMYEDWFLDYASYVILERAIPNIDDGFKPVQRRILHSMREMHDNRYHKVANIIGNTMKYHPHGDKAIGDALVSIAQKDLLIDMQGNWGDVRTGDKAAAARYIEARLTSFALDVIFNKNITLYEPSYDGRNSEPVSLPVKFPLILVHGTEGIAVGLSTKILPHNFSEIVKASISILKDKPFKIYPDFSTGGMIDIQNYNKGSKGGRVRIRSNVEILNKDTLRISDIPYGITTTSLIDSIIKANNAGKIKIKNIEDNTAEDVEIIIHLIKGVSPNVTIDALYAFTNCEISISPNCCIIVNNKPEFITVNKLLKKSTINTLRLLKEELLFKLNQLNSKWHIINLEKIFIENKIYLKIEECDSWESILEIIEKSLNPFLKEIKKEISNDDLIHLTEIKIKKISKYDIIKQRELLDKIEEEIKIINNNLENITPYAINYFKDILKKYGDKHIRKTQIQEFDSISVRRVAVANKKLYVNKKEGFIGTSIKKDEFVSKCSNLDNVIVFTSDGNYLVTKVEEKKYIGKNILHVAVWKKNDKHMIYNAIYFDGLSKYTYVKRFAVTSIIKDRVYNLTKGNQGSKVIYFTANPNSESEIVEIFLHHKTKANKKIFEYDFSNFSIKNRSAKGNILSKYIIRKVSHKSSGSSTLGGRDIWLDENIGRLNTENNGLFLGRFETEDKIIVFYNDGSYEMTDFNLSNRYKISDIILIEKFSKKNIYTMLHQEGKSKNYYLKRFTVETNMIDRKFSLIQDSRGSKCIIISNYFGVDLKFNYRLKNGEKKSNVINVNNFISVKGSKALGKKVSYKKNMSAFTFVENDIKLDKEKQVNIINDNELTLF